MRIAYLLRKRIPSTETITLQAVTMAAELARAGAEVHLVATAVEVPGREEVLAAYDIEPTEGLQIHGLRRRWGGRFNRWRGRRFRRSLDRLLLDLGTDIVYLRGERGLEVAASLLARRAPFRVVYEVHKIFRLFHLDRSGSETDRKVRRAATLERAVYRGADSLVAIGEGLAEGVRAETGSERPVLVAPNGTAPNRRVGLEPRDVEIVYAGDLAPWKGVGALVEAMERLPGRRLRILGGYRPGDVEALRADVRERGLADRVSVEGPQPPEAIPPLLARTRVVPLPLPADNEQARRFTSPLKLFQALEAGCAVVATDLPSVREVVEPDRDALIVPPGDADALAAGIERVLADDALRDRLGAAGRRTARSYRWDVRARNVRAFLAKRLLYG